MRETKLKDIQVYGIVSVGGRTALVDEAGMLEVIFQQPIEIYYMGWKKKW